MDSKKITFANFLKDVRSKRNLTKEELANLSFINKKTISNMENAKVNYDLNHLENLSSVLKVDLVEKFFDVFFGETTEIDSIIDSLNSRDRINGISQAKDIENLEKIKKKTNRKIVKIKAQKLIFFLKSIGENEDSKTRRDLIVKALKVNENFDFDKLDLNYYEKIDYRILMNYALTLKDKKEKLRIYKFIESSLDEDDSLMPILYNNMANLYFVLENKKKASAYIDRAINLNKNNPPSAVMFYTKALILESLDLPFESYLEKSLDLAKDDRQTYQHILQVLDLNNKDKNIN